MAYVHLGARTGARTDILLGPLEGLEAKMGACGPHTPTLIYLSIV